MDVSMSPILAAALGLLLQASLLLPYATQPSEDHHDNGDDCDPSRSNESLPLSSPLCYGNASVNSSTELARSRGRRAIPGIDYRECCCDRGVQPECLPNCLSFQLSQAAGYKYDSGCVSRFFCQISGCIIDHNLNNRGKPGPSSVEEILKGECIAPLPQSKAGTCPFVDINPDHGSRVCSTRCKTDEDCNTCRGFMLYNSTMKCCRAPCGTDCVEPGPPPSACEIHRMDTIGNLSDLLTSVSDFWRFYIWLPQCSRTGNRSYEAVQCILNTQQCFCVDHSGREIDGTRRLSDEGRPNCTDRTPRPLTPCKEHVSEILRLHARALNREEFYNLSIWLPLCQDADPLSSRTYQHKQCLVQTGHCWCVNHQGDPLVDTIIGPGDSIVDFICPRDDKISQCESTVGQLARQHHKLELPAEDLHKVFTRNEYESRGIWLPRCAPFQNVTSQELEAGGYAGFQCDEFQGTIRCWCTSPDGLEYSATTRNVTSSSYGELALLPMSPLSDIFQRTMDHCRIFRVKNLRGCERGYREASLQYKLSNRIPLYTVTSEADALARSLPQCEVLASSEMPFPYRPMQCNSFHCWCVDVAGKEVLGSRLSATLGHTLNCLQLRKCSIPPCMVFCPNGHVLDSNGCITCQCKATCTGQQQNSATCQPHCLYRTSNEPLCSQCNTTCNKIVLASCQVDSACRFTQACLFKDGQQECLTRGTQDYACWVNELSSSMYRDSYRSLRQASAQDRQTCSPSLYCKTGEISTKGVCQKLPSSRDCSLNGTMVLRDGEPWINRSACHLCACKQGVLLCRQLPRELTHYCLSQDWETMYSRGRPREMLLLSHKSCKVSQDQALSKVTRQIIDGSSIRLSCNWCKCSGGRLTCTNRNCNSRHDQRFETCPECIVTAANKLWSTSNTTSLPVCSKTMKTFQTRCHASRCGHFADESLKTGACGLVEPCRAAVCPQGTTCTPRQGVCFNEPCPQFDCVSPSPVCKSAMADDLRVCGTDGVTYQSLCFLQLRNVPLAYSQACHHSCTTEVCGGDRISYPSRCHAYQAGVHVDYGGRCSGGTGDMSRAAICEQMLRENRCADVSNCTQTVTPPGSCCPLCGGSALVTIDIALLALFRQDFGSHFNHPLIFLDVLREYARARPVITMPPGLPVHEIPVVTMPSVRPIIRDNISECNIFFEFQSRAVMNVIAESLVPTASMSIACQQLIEHFVSVVNADSTVMTSSIDMGTVSVGAETIGASMLAAVELFDLASSAAGLFTSTSSLVTCFLATTVFLMLMVNNI